MDGSTNATTKTKFPSVARWWGCSQTYSASTWTNLTFDGFDKQDSSNNFTSQTASSITTTCSGVVVINAQTFVSSPTNYGVGVLVGSELHQAEVWSNHPSDVDFSARISANTTITFRIYGTTGEFHNYNFITSASVLFIPD